MGTEFWIALILLGLSLLVIVLLLIKLHAVNRNKQQILAQQQQINARVLDMVSNLQGGIICSKQNDSGKFVANYVSDGWSRLTGYSLQDVQELLDGCAQMLIVSEDRDGYTQQFAQVLSDNLCYFCRYRYVHKSGAIRCAIERGVLVKLEDGSLELQSIFHDVTDTEKKEQLLKDSEQRFRISTLVADTVVYEFDLRSNRYTYFANASKIFGIEDNNMLDILNTARGDTVDAKSMILLKEIICDQDLGEARSSTNTLMQSGECRTNIRLMSQGTAIWCRHSCKLIKDDAGKATRVIGALTDIDESKRQSDILEQKVKIEPLTGLYNRVAAREQIDDYLNDNATVQSAMLLIDIDNFKSLNDSFGHTYGDMVLVDIAARIKSIFGADEILARIGGDEFLVFLPRVESSKQAEDYAGNICDSFKKVRDRHALNYQVSCSVGVACGVGSSYQLLVEQSDLAMYEAKHLGKDRYVLFDSNKTYENHPVVVTQVSQYDGANSKSITHMVFDLLFSTPDFARSVNMMLSFLCNWFGFDHAYIFENTRGNDSSINTFEWRVNGDCSALPVMAPLNKEQVSSYEEFYRDNSCYYSSQIEQYDTDAQNALEMRNIRAIWHMPLLDGNQFRGIIGFGKNDAHTKPSEQDIATLSSVVKVLAVFIRSHRFGEEIYHNSNDKAYMIDQLPSYVYITDNEHRILFMNQSMVTEYPEVLLGKMCYKALMNNPTVCDNCPKMKVTKGVFNSQLVTAFGAGVIAATKLIDWDGKDAYLVTCLPIDSIVTKALIQEDK